MSYPCGRCLDCGIPIEAFRIWCDDCLSKNKGETMKTLSEILWENVLNHLDLGENGAYDEINEFEEDLLNSFKEWLTQKRQDENDHSMIPTRFWQGTIDELLEELVSKNSKAEVSK